MSVYVTHWNKQWGLAEIDALKKKMHIYIFGIYIYTKCHTTTALKKHIYQMPHHNYFEKYINQKSHHNCISEHMQTQAKQISNKRLASEKFAAGPRILCNTVKSIHQCWPLAQLIRACTLQPRELITNATVRGVGGQIPVLGRSKMRCWQDIFKEGGRSCRFASLT